MKIGILLVGQVDSHVASGIQENLKMIFAQTKSTLIDERIPIPEGAFDNARKQYRSDLILSTIRKYVEEKNHFDRILGVVDVDIFVPRMHFVFGEAERPGRTALISLWRLRPEFYGDLPNEQLLGERSVKEAVHEIGHTLSLEHCPNPFCVMHFSNNIYETDVKRGLFCEVCSVHVEIAISKLGKNYERHV